jgi:predicted transcriptional regulator
MAMGNPVSFRLSDDSIKILKKAEAKLGLSRSAVVELAIRHFLESDLMSPKKKSQAVS